MKITAQTKICMVIGDPVAHSLSPTIFNAGFEQLGIDNQFVYVGCTVPPEKLEDFIKGARAMNIQGISCTIPHKLQIMRYLDEVDEVAKRIGAVNTIVNENGRLKGFNMDWQGAVGPLKKITELKGKKVAVIGAGGAERAIVYGLTQNGVDVTLFNRTIEKAEGLVKDFNIKILPLDKMVEVENMEIIINATSIGMSTGEIRSPLNKDLITPNHIVFDVVYNPLETQLLKDAKEQGAQTVSGSEMFLAQAAEQFKLFTGRKAPEEAMRKALLNELTKKEI